MPGGLNRTTYARIKIETLFKTVLLNLAQYAQAIPAEDR
jgi:hypothetical protein